MFGSPTANIAIDRGSQSGGFASLDFFNNMTSSTGWSVQMQPNSNNLSFLDRATGLTRVTLEQGTGNVGIGTDNPTAHLQVGSSPQNFSDVTTLGVGQGSGDTVALSLRRLSNDPIMQFCSDGTGGCSYVAFDRLTGEINIGADGSGNNPVLSVEKTGGQVGIGKTNAGVPLDVEGPGVTNGLEKLIRLNNTAATHPGRSFAQQQSTGNLGGALHIVDETSGAGSRLVIRGNGNVGIGTGTTSSPSAKLEVAGQVKITGGSPGAGKVLTSDANGLASWGTPATGGANPRVIHTPDTRPGCPAFLPLDTPIISQTFSVSGSTPVSITADIIRQDSGRRDLYLYVDGGLVDRTLTYSPDTQWIDAHEVWSGILSNGSHTVTIKSPDSVRFGCGAEWGAIETIIFD
ncbi:MAG TPA: hypothetical protein EYM54_17145 [Dehalococcoidia bacterium]|nr:hypothetical protein [Dehalococcoidia bacterium]